MLNHFINQCNHAPKLVINQEKVWIDNLEINDSSAEIGLNGSSVYRIRSTSNDEFIITKNGYEQITHHSKNIDDLII